MAQYKKYILTAIITFIILISLNFLRIMVEFDTYTAVEYNNNKQELSTIRNNIHQISDSLFDNIVNTEETINIFKHAHKSNTKQKAILRKQLFELLEDEYQKFTKYGIQQFHFHLPNNESFLRFHKPNKFGDNLTGIRKSVEYVNQHKKSISGFEEGKIFNGYRFVYPLKDENGVHIGSVEISSSLLNLKKLYEQNKANHIDYIILKSYVEKKLFSSELKNYKQYYTLNDFFIQSNIAKENALFCPHIPILKKFFNDKQITNQLENIDNYNFTKIIDNKIYTLSFIPLQNDFVKKDVGYSVILYRSYYLDYFLHSILGSTLSVLFFSFLIAYIFYLYTRTLETQEEKLFVKLQNERLLHSNQLIESIFNSTTDLISYKDNNFKYLGCNEAFGELAGKNKHAVIGKTDFDLFDDETATIFRNMDNILLKNNDITSNYEWVEYPNGDKVYLLTQKIPFQYDVDDLDSVGILSISRDLTELYETQKKLREQTFTDELTQIHNRKSYNKRLGELLSGYERYGTTFSFIVFDIDKFKAVNDTYGHDMGDKVLIDLCKLISTNIRSNDYFFRIGGEEFVILLTNTQIDGAISFAENIRINVEKNLHTIKESQITISLGVTQVKKEDTPESIFARADSLLYISKDTGRNKLSSDA